MPPNMGKFPPTSSGKKNRFQPPKKEHVILKKGTKTTNLLNPMTRSPGLVDKFAPHTTTLFDGLFFVLFQSLKKENTVGFFIADKPSWIDPLSSPPSLWRIVPPARGGQFSQMVVDQGCKVSVLEGFPKWCPKGAPKGAPISKWNYGAINSLTNR